MAAILKGPVVSLFSGAMGLDLGLEQAGIETTLAVEVDPYCCATIRKNQPAVDVWEADVEKISGEAVRSRFNNQRTSFLWSAAPRVRAFAPAARGRPYRTRVET